MPNKLPNENDAVTDSTDTITQSMLHRLKSTRDQIKALETEAAECRKNILRLHDAGVTAQAGELSLRISTYSRQPLTQSAVREILGDESLAKLLAGIKPTETPQVCIAVDDEMVRARGPWCDPPAPRALLRR